MGDPSETMPMMEEDVEQRSWQQENEEAIEDTEDTYQRHTSEKDSSHTPAAKRKAKKKDDGPLEIVCGMIVEHQIGMSRFFLPDRLGPRTDHTI